jgi:hypothetical protein
MKLLGRGDNQPAPSIAEVKEIVELYLYYPSGLPLSYVELSVTSLRATVYRYNDKLQAYYNHTIFSKFLKFPRD